MENTPQQPSCVESGKKKDFFLNIKDTNPLEGSSDFLCLGVETSCDETALALLKGSEVLGHEIYTQHHQQGVIPSLAARQHGDILPFLAKVLEQKTGIALKEVHGIGVTTGPGLLGGLLSGSLWAQGLSLSPLFEGKEPIPLWSVHHLGAHGLVARLHENIPFPFALLLLSGGHCLLMLVKGPQDFYRLGQSLDDAPGECLDKIARFMAGLYPGGPFIEQWAKKGCLNPNIHLPVALENRQDCCFSFSGLKTAALQWLEKYKNTLSAEDQRKSLCSEGYFIMDHHPLLWDFCFSLQYVLGKALGRGLRRGLSLLKASSDFVPHFPFVMGGGVAANGYLRSTLKLLCEEEGFSFHCPPPSLCTDNGIMVAWATQEYKKAGIAPSSFLYCDPSWTLDQWGKKNKGCV